MINKPTGKTLNRKKINSSNFAFCTANSIEQMKYPKVKTAVARINKSQ